jgi:hypothetical protein
MKPGPKALMLGQDSTVSAKMMPASSISASTANSMEMPPKTFAPT